MANKDRFGRNLLVLTFCLLSASVPVVAQQWEQLPLYGGGLYQLRPSTFDENVILGFKSQNDELYYSSDRGKTWESIYDSNQNVWPYILDVEALKDGRILVIARSGVWVTEDHGGSWKILDEGFEKTIYSRADINTCHDESIVLSLNDYVTRVNMISKDNGSTWDTLALQANSWGLFVDKTNSDIILKLSASVVNVTTDGGKFWSEHPLPYYPITKISANKADGGLLLSAFFENRAEPDYSDCYYCESIDTGRTWIATSSGGVDLRHGRLANYIDDNIVKFDSLRIIANVRSRFIISEDGGQSWTDQGMRVFNVVACGDTLIASVDMDGIIRSTDQGRTWESYQIGQYWDSLGKTEFAIAHGDTCFALVHYAGGVLDAECELRQSLDGGWTWEVLFRGAALNYLEVDVGSPSRYYLSAIPNDGRKALLTGLANQRIPDTISVPKEWAVLHASKRFPGHLYATMWSGGALSGGPLTFGYSSDRGATWSSTLVDPYFGGIWSSPSLLDPRRVVLRAKAYHEIFDEYAGLYYTSDAGMTWEFVNDDEDLTYRILPVTGQDEYFYNYPISRSTDYGRTWGDAREGLDSTVGGLNYYNPGGRLIGVSDDTFYGTSDGEMYEYRSGRWHKLMGSDGRILVSRYAGGWDNLCSVDVDDMYLYMTVPGEGLFRAKISHATAVQESVRPEEAGLESVYPNPAAGHVTIAVNSVVAEHAMLRIYDVLGKIVLERRINGNQKLMWNRRNNQGRRVHNGVYFIELTSGHQSWHRMLVLQ